MELNITELNDYYDKEYNYDASLSYEPIPENTVINVVKKSVHFSESNPMKKSNAILKPTPNLIQKPSISYEDILAKMGMLVVDGKLHFVPKNTRQPIQQPMQPQTQTQSPIIGAQNSYIYNKYFKDEIKPEHNIRIPKTRQEYKRMLIEDFIKRQQIKQMKSTKLIMPTTNIHISGGGNLNKLFSMRL